MTPTFVRQIPGSGPPWSAPGLIALDGASSWLFLAGWSPPEPPASPTASRCWTPINFRLAGLPVMYDQTFCHPAAFPPGLESVVEHDTPGAFACRHPVMAVQARSVAPIMGAGEVHMADSCLRVRPGKQRTQNSRLHPQKRGRRDRSPAVQSCGTHGRTIQRLTLCLYSARDLILGGFLKPEGVEIRTAHRRLQNSKSAAFQRRG